MTYQATHSSDVNNVGPLDRVNRIIVGTTLIMVTVLFTAIPAAAVAGIVMLGLYAGLTGFIGWDPLYSVTRALQQRAPAQTAATVSMYRRRGEQPAADGYQKAA